MNRSVGNVVRLVCCISALAACSSKAEQRPDAKATPPPAAEAKPQPAAPSKGLSPELAAMVAREFPALGRQKASGTGFTLEVEGTAPPEVQAVEGQQLVKVDLGTKGPMQCFVHAQPLDAAGAMAAVLGAAQKSVKFRGVAITDVKMVEEQPVLFANADYLAEVNGNKAMGQLKMMVHVRGNSSLMCMHDEPGYQESFKRVALGAAATFAPTGWTKPGHHYVEIQVVHMGSATLGFSHHACTRTKSGTQCDSTDALLAARGPGQFIAVDTVSKETSDADGVVTSKLFLHAEGGELSTNLQVTRTAPSEYGFKGTTASKEVSGSFKTRTAKGITSEAELRRVVLDVVKTQKAREVDQYVASVAPDAATPMTVAPGPRPGTVNVVMAGKSILNEVDDDGLGKRSELPLGQVVMSFDRLYVRGIP